MAGQCAFHCIVTVLVSHLLLSSGISQLDFTTEPQDVVALEGEPLRLECQVTGKQTKKENILISWRHNGVEIVPNNRTYVLDGGALYFEEVVVDWEDEDDKGRYQCCAKSVLGVLCSRHADVSIAKLSRPEVILTNDEPLVADINGTARLVCDMEDHPAAQVTWFKDDTPVQMVDSQRMIPLQSGVLQIIQVSLSDAGQYHCSATNAVGNRTSDSFQLTVTTLADMPPQPLPPSSSTPSQPLIIAGPQNAMILAGSSYLLECAVSNTSVEVKWTKRDYFRNIGLSIPRDRIQRVGLSSLLITGLQASDSGRYVCTVRQSSSSVMQQAEALLFVTVPPVFTRKPRDRSNEDVGLTNVRMHCEADGNSAPTITWMYNGEKVDMESKRIKQWDNNDLTIWNVQDTDAGIYQCVASNEAGEVQAGALFTFNIPDNAPDPPRNLTAIPQSESMIIMWIPPPNQTVDAYTLHYQKVSGGEIDYLPVCRTCNSYHVEELTSYTEYLFWMRSYANGAASMLSERVVAMTTEGVPSCSPHFYLISDSPYSIEIHWNTIPVTNSCRNGIITKYRYCNKQAGHKKYSCTEVSTSISEQNVLKVWQLTPSTTYYITMAAATAQGFGTDSEWAVIRTPGTPDCEVPPVFTLEWSVVNASFVQLDWLDPEPAVNVSVDGFHLVVTTGGGGQLEDRLELDSEMRAYALTDLDPGSDYDVILYAVNDCGFGQEWSETITMPELADDGASEPATGGTPPDISFPTNLKATDIQSTRIELTWKPPLSDITPDYYVITYWPSFDVREAPKTVSSSTYQVLVSDLSPFTPYTFKVQAVVRIGGENIKGDAITGHFKTLETGPSEPTNVGATPINPHAVEVMWDPPRQPNGIIALYIIWYNHDITQPEQNWNKTNRKGDVKKDIINHLNSNTTYFFRVQASNKAGPGPLSAPVLVHTPPVNLAVETPPAKSVLDPNVQKVILASIVLVTFLCLLFTVVLVCRDWLQKRNQRQQLHVVGAGNGRNTEYQQHPYGREPRSNTHPMHEGMDMEMSPMLPSNASLQGNMTPGRRLGNSDSGNHSPYFTRGVVTNQGVGSTAAGSYLASPYQQPYHMRYRDYRSPECQVIVHQQQTPFGIHPPQQQQHLIRKQGASADADSVGASLHTHSDTHYLPGQQFNSGQNSTPQNSGQSSSPQLHMDQDDVVAVADDKGEVVVNKEESVLRYAVGSGGEQEQERHRWRERDKLGLHLPYTLASTTSCTVVAPCGSHDSNLPPETNHRDDNERHDNLDIWGDGGVRRRDNINENDEDDDSQNLPSCGSTGGDSGMIDEEEWDPQDTSPDFVEKALLEVSGDVVLYTV